MKIKPIAGGILVLFAFIFIIILSFVLGWFVSGKESYLKRMFKKKRDKSLKLVVIGKQKAYFRKSSQPKPLIVRLHNWSSDYKNADRMSFHAAKLDWNYIHPDFQGSNNKPDACGSRKVIVDIDIAIDYAIKNGNVDMDKIYVVGASGGGMATLLTFMKSKHKIDTFMAWVPITDLEAWYYESIGRKQKYASDILKCTSSKGKLNVEEARKRSPLYVDTPLEKLQESKVKIFAGIHDEIVPMTHAVKFYNKIAREMGEEIIKDKEIISLLEKRVGEKEFGKINERQIYLYRRINRVELTVFDGGHEMLGKYVVDELSREEETLQSQKLII